MTKNYPNLVRDRSEQLGFKSANLVFLDTELKNFNSQSSIKISVPKFKTLSHDEILSHLNNYAPGWLKIWESFKDIQGDARALSQDAISALKNLQNIITECFEKNTFAVDLEFDKDLMVRSTGKEDSTTIANAGGNESFPSSNNPVEISAKIGRVIASYFGEKSFNQRLLSGDDILRNPFMPILLQEMISEKNEAMVYSGVIYTGENGTVRIQAAPGHGELIVNSKGNFDDYYISKQGMIYSEISRSKLFRIKSEFEKGRLLLKELYNDSQLQQSSSLQSEALVLIRKVALFIESAYSMKMDIEFVYDQASQTLNIVQARALPEHYSSIKPIALSNEYLSKIENDGGQILKGSSITPDLKSAVSINDPKDLIVVENIGDALIEFLKEGKVKAVVVKRNAPTTSHEAGEFKSKNIPVIRVDDIQKVKTFITELASGKNIIIDPQRSSIFQIPAKYSGKDLKEAGILEEGLFCSSLSSNITIQKYDFQPTGQRMTLEKTVDNLGDLVFQARMGDQEASDKLFNFLFDKIHENPVEPVHIAKDFLSKIELLSSYNGNPDRHNDAIISIIKTVTKLTKKGIITKDIFVEINLIAAELLLAIENFKDKNDLSNYLDIFKKFEGIIISQGDKDIDSESIFRELAYAKHREEMFNKFPEVSNFSEEIKEIFISSTILKKYFFTSEKSDEFIRFCLEECQNEQSAKQLSTLIFNVVKADIATEWCNIIFNSNDSLAKLFADIDQSKQHMYTLEINKIIYEMKNQIESWQDPKQFDKLLAAFSDQLLLIREKLKFDKGSSFLSQLVVSKQMSELIEVVDLSLKSLKASHKYSNTILLANNFCLMLQQAFDLMKDWSQDFPNTQESSIESYCERFNPKESKKEWVERELRSFKFLGEYRMQLISSSLQEYKIAIPEDIDNLMEQDKLIDHIRPLLEENILSGKLSPSLDFNVGWARIDKFASGAKSASNLKAETLEDIFTLIHQNLIIALGVKSKLLNSKILEECPKVVRDFNKQIMDLYQKTQQYEVLEPHIVLSEVSYPEIIIQYNVPLRHHSCSIKVSYDIKTKDISISAEFCGENELSRWNASEVQALLYLFFKPEKLSIIDEPKFVREQLKFSYAFKCKNDVSIKYAIDIIEKTIENTFASNNKTNIISNLFLEKIKALTLQQLEELKQLFTNKLYEEEDESSVDPNSERASNDFIRKEVLMILEYLINKNNGNFETLNSLLSKKNIFYDAFEPLKKFIMNDQDKDQFFQSFIEDTEFSQKYPNIYKFMQGDEVEVMGEEDAPYW